MSPRVSFMSARDRRRTISHSEGANGLLPFLCSLVGRTELETDAGADEAEMIGGVQLDREGQIQFFSGDEAQGIVAKFRHRKTASEFLELAGKMLPGEIFHYYAQGIAAAQTKSVDEDGAGTNEAPPTPSVDGFKRYVRYAHWTEEWRCKNGSKSGITKGEHDVVLGVAHCSSGAAKIYIRRKRSLGSWGTVCSLTIEKDEMGVVWSSGLTKSTWEFGVVGESDDSWHALFWSPDTEKMDSEIGD